MCGVAGEVTFDGERADTDVVRRMAATMRDRGPDGEGSWSCGWAALGHRRLSVIDLSDAGGQPMQSADARVTIVFNGCVYNHRELRHELEPGRPFGTTSDTEVVLAAYERWGARFVDHLVGMFAVVVVDERRREVVLARDRLGVKPSTWRPSAVGCGSRRRCRHSWLVGASTRSSTRSGSITT